MSRAIEFAFPDTLRDREFPEMLQELRRRLRQPPVLSYRERLAVLNDLADSLLARSTTALGATSTAGLPFLVGFLRATNLEHLLSREIARPEALEHFVTVDGRKSLRLVPKGLVCHWIAGNVPLLGMFSWAMSALVGNLNVIRVSTKQEDLVSPLLRHMANLSKAGRELAEQTTIVYFDRENREAHEAMSAVADVRIAWGGRDAVAGIKALPSRWECDDIALGPRVSLAVVDPALATDRMIARLATDVVYFDQLACTSPQWLFVKGTQGEAAFESFVERFSAAFADQSQAIVRHPLDWAETYRIHLDRARILLGGGSLRRDARTQWTLALVDSPNDTVACANRFLQMVPFADVRQIYPRIPTNVQTVVCLLGGEEATRFTEEASRYGVCRFPRPGEGNFFESPWDGLPMISRLTRWVLRTDPRN